jgi:hypothetical protein
MSKKFVSFLTAKGLHIPLPSRQLHSREIDFLKIKGDAPLICQMSYKTRILLSLISAQAMDQVGHSHS